MVVEFGLSIAEPVALSQTKLANTPNARNEEEAQNAVHDIDFDTVQYSDENISWLNASVESIDI